MPRCLLRIARGYSVVCSMLGLDPAARNAEECLNLVAEIMGAEAIVGFADMALACMGLGDNVGLPGAAVAGSREAQLPSTRLWPRRRWPTVPSLVAVWPHRGYTWTSSPHISDDNTPS